MDNTWIKLYRKINLNAIMRDPVALQLFIWILTNADKETGEVIFARFIVAKELGVNPNTLYSALKRLVQKYKIVEFSSTTEYTTIKLLNWAKYQPQKDNVNTSNTNQSTTTHQPINTYTRIENKNKEINREIYASLDYLRELPEKEIEELCKKYDVSPIALKKKAEGLLNYCVGHGKKYKNYRAMLLNALLKDFGYRKPTYTPNLIMPEQTPEEREKAREKINQIREQLHGSFKARV